MTLLFRLAVLGIAAGVLCAPLSAQDQAEPRAHDAPLQAGPTTFEAAAGDPDFFFGRPVFTLTVRFGAFAPRAGSEFHEFTFDRFTLDRNDLRSFTGGIEAGIWLGDHAEINLAVDGFSVTRQTNYREFVEQHDDGTFSEIRQNTRFSQSPSLTLGLRLFPLPRGDELSQFVWVPRTVAPFVAFGVGGMGYAVEQWGDWVEESDGSIFTEEFSSSGGSYAAYLGGGIEVTLRPRVALVLDARYLWGSDRMTGDFFRFEPLDLSGRRMTAGLSYRF